MTKRYKSEKVWVNVDADGKVLNGSFETKEEAEKKAPEDTVRTISLKVVPGLIDRRERPC